MLLVVIHDLDVVRVPFFPTKADTPLIVSANRTRTCAIAFEYFQSETRGPGVIK